MKSRVFLIILLILLFSQCFSFIGWNGTLGGYVVKAVCLLMALIVLVEHKKLPVTPISKIVGFLMMLPFLSDFGAAVIHNQSLAEGILQTSYSLTYLFFYLLYIWKVDYKIILKICLCFGVFWCAMEIIQQFTYPHIWFATRIETRDKAIEIRNGIYRLNMEGREFGLLLLFYSFQKYIEKNRKIFLLGILLGLVGIYMLATRQIIAVALGCLFYALWVKHKIKIGVILGLIAIGGFIYLNFETLFGDYIQMTENMDENYIRFIAYNYYGLEYNNGNLLAAIIGNGDPGRSAYGMEIARLEDFGLYRADIGIVGMYSLYGIFYVLVIIVFFAYTIKKRKYIAVYLQMYILYMLVTSIMLHHFGYSTHHIMSLCCVLYLTDKSIQINKLKSSE